MLTTGHLQKSGKLETIRDLVGRSSPARGRRPVLLLSRSDAYEFLNKVIAAEITTTIRNIPIEVRLGPAEKLKRKCAVNCDNLRTIPKQHLTSKISSLPAHRVIEIKRAMGYALGWEELIGADDRSQRPSKLN